MDPAKIKAALEAIKNGDADAALKLLEEMIASAAGGSEAPAEGDALADNADPPAEEESPAEQATALARAVKLAEESDKQVKELTERLSKIEKERAAGESAERAKLVGDLVKLGVEVPATAWEGDPEKKKPVKRLADEPIAELRKRVEVLSKAKPQGKPPGTPPAAPEGEGRVIKLSRGGEITLTPSEVKACEETGAKLEAYAENKAVREAARRRNQ